MLIMGQIENKPLALKPFIKCLLSLVTHPRYEKNINIPEQKKNIFK
jgi:hypothetical protein